MNHDFIYLYFGHSFDNTKESFKVYKESTKDICGIPFTFKIIGHSHYIHSEVLDFHDVLSSKGLTSFHVKSEITKLGIINLKKNLSKANIISETSSMKLSDCEAKFGDLDSTFSHFFGEREVTGIRFLDSGYETIHTYPEHNIGIYTKTTLSLKYFL